jgi:hypothetical protein
MVVARGIVQQGFGQRRPALGLAAQQQAANGFRLRRPARLARHHHVAAGAREALGQQPAWVDLPEPSPPSSVMKKPGCPPGHPPKIM